MEFWLRNPIPISCRWPRHIHGIHVSVLLVPIFLANRFPNVVGNPNLPASQQSIHHWFNLNAFALPPSYVYGNEGRGTVEGPPLHNMDLMIGRNVFIGERVHLEFRGELFNFTNTPHFALPNATVNSPSEGQITSTVGNPRQIQLALKLVF